MVQIAPLDSLRGCGHPIWPISYQWRFVESPDPLEITLHFNIGILYLSRRDLSIRHIVFMGPYHTPVPARLPGGLVFAWILAALEALESGSLCAMDCNTPEHSVSLCRQLETDSMTKSFLCDAGKIPCDQKGECWREPRWEIARNNTITLNRTALHRNGFLVCAFPIRSPNASTRSDNSGHAQAPRSIV